MKHCQRFSSTDCFSQNTGLHVGMHVGWRKINTMKKCKKKMQGQIMLDTFFRQLQCRKCPSALMMSKSESSPTSLLWYNIAMGSMLLLPISLDSHAICSRKHAISCFLFAKHLSQQSSVSNLSPWYYCNRKTK